jgi:hydroxymethylglutaryl-CoA lyase
VRDLAPGLSVIEAGSFVSPKWVPQVRCFFPFLLLLGHHSALHYSSSLSTQMADTSSVYAMINRGPNISYPVLVPNMQGMERAIESNANEIAVFAAASESFSKKNINCSIKVPFPLPSTLLVPFVSFIR